MPRYRRRSARDVQVIIRDGGSRKPGSRSSRPRYGAKARGARSSWRGPRAWGKGGLTRKSARDPGKCVCGHPSDGYTIDKRMVGPYNCSRCGRATKVEYTGKGSFRVTAHTGKGRYHVLIQRKRWTGTPLPEEYHFATKEKAFLAARGLTKRETHAWARVYLGGELLGIFHQGKPVRDPYALREPFRSKFSRRDPGRPGTKAQKRAAWKQVERAYGRRDPSASDLKHYSGKALLKLLKQAQSAGNEPLEEAIGRELDKRAKKYGFY